MRFGVLGTVRLGNLESFVGVVVVVVVVVVVDVVVVVVAAAAAVAVAVAPPAVIVAAIIVAVALVTLANYLRDDQQAQAHPAADSLCLAQA